MLVQLWPYINDMVIKILKETVEPEIQKNVPSFLSSIHFGQISLGQVVSCDVLYHCHHPLTILVDRTPMMTIPLSRAFCMSYSNTDWGGHLDLYACGKELQGPFLYWLVTLCGKVIKDWFVTYTFLLHNWINAFFEILTKSFQLITLSWKHVTDLIITTILCFVAKKLLFLSVASSYWWYQDILSQCWQEWDYLGYWSNVSWSRANYA